jgi:hypothetical protein
LPAVVATAAGGGELLRQPSAGDRGAAFFDRFPDYERVRVTTGWIKAEVAGRATLDERIATDPERFWDRFQSKTLPALYDHVWRSARSRP